MLDSLKIKNFRSLADFEVAKLGRVNLIVGKNNSGKSSVLEALRIYAGNAQRPLLEAISLEHDERIYTRDSESIEPDAPFPFQDFFTGRQFPDDDRTLIQIGSATSDKDMLGIQYVLLVKTEETLIDGKGDHSVRVRRRPMHKSESPDLFDEVSHALLITKGDKMHPPILLETAASRLRPSMFDVANAIPCSVVPTQFISADELAVEWDRIALTEHENVVRLAMRIIAPTFENLAFVLNDDLRPGYRLNPQRSAKVKLSDVPRPVPLNSLGDGMLRVLQLTLKMFPAKGGFLLIDEFENGLHFSVQEKVWALLFDMAEKLDIQVFATTHSWDCIESFTKVAIARTQTDGILFRMGRSVRKSDHGKIIATVFDEDALKAITQADMEVR